MIVEYGISFISILNFFKGISEIIDDYIKIGFETFQSLPLKKVKGDEKMVDYFEDVWRPSLKNVFQIQLDSIFGDLVSLYLFKSNNKRDEILRLYELQKRTQIKHSWSYIGIGDYVEISNQMDAKNLKNIAIISEAMELNLVPDIKHLKEFTEKYNVTIDKVVDELGHLFAPIIHFQPICNVKKFINKKDIDNSEEIHIFKSVLHTILKNFDEGKYKTKKLTIIIEYNPGLLFFSKKRNLETARNMLEIVKKYV